MTVSKKKKKPSARTLPSFEKTERVAANIICILAFIAFAFIAVYSVIQTSVIDPENYISEKILYKNDNVIMNILFFVLYFVVFYALSKTYGFFSKINIHIMEGAVVAVPLILGLIWVLSVQTVPAADSMNVFESAAGAANGDYTPFLSNDQFYNHAFYSDNSYYYFYPFQLGIVFISEMLYHIFGTETALPLEILNVLCNAMAYLAVAKIAGAIFKRKSVEFVTIILLIGCIQPVLFTAFPYGNIIGMCCALWSAYFLIRYFETGKYLLFIPIIVLLTLATLAKYNNMIYLVAFAIVLLLHTLRAKKWQSLALILALVLSCVGASKLIIFSYEQRAETEFKSGVSQTLYLDMGLNESWMAPGWYTKLGLETYRDNNFDTDAANEAAKENIKTRLDAFAKDPEYACEFFSKKIVSQWNEPTYESIWVSKVKSHYTELKGLAESVYDGDLGRFLEKYFERYMQFAFVMFSAGLLLIVLRKKANIQTMLLPLVLLGAFAYHLLFEGKSQYVLTYIILLTPYAAYCAMSIIDAMRKYAAAHPKENAKSNKKSGTSSEKAAQ